MVRSRRCEHGAWMHERAPQNHCHLSTDSSTYKVPPAARKIPLNQPKSHPAFMRSWFVAWENSGLSASASKHLPQYQYDQYMNLQTTSYQSCSMSKETHLYLNTANGALLLVLNPSRFHTAFIIKQVKDTTTFSDITCITRSGWDS